MKETKICVIGLGYVGLPLARLFSTKYKTVGFDMNMRRCEALMAGHDATLEVSDELLQEAINNHSLVCTADIEQIRDCNFYVVAVPTPVDENNNPDLTPLYGASTTVGKVISKGDVVVYESTVYPGVTEDECIPVVEKISGMKFNEDFFAGYSPERINPGDKKHTVEHIKKVTSGSTPEIGQYVNAIYSSVIIAGTHLAPTIKVAEAAKVIENSQRDINIAFVNELSHIFNKMGIDTLDVLEAAGTKWNFLPFRPGLVGGHCIGVDPYYLAQCAQRHGHNPEIILAGRRMNDGMGEYVATETVKHMLKKGIQVLNSEIIILGFTLQNVIETSLRNLWITVTVLLVFGILLWMVDAKARQNKTMNDMTYRDAFLFGLGQSMALIPGVSRSGGTITVGRALGYTREAAVRLSFLMAIPAVFGSGLLEAIKAVKNYKTDAMFPGWGPTLVAMVISFVLGYIVIIGFLKFVSNFSYKAFAIYRIGLAVVVALLLIVGVLPAIDPSVVAAA